VADSTLIIRPGIITLSKFVKADVTDYLIHVLGNYDKNITFVVPFFKTEKGKRKIGIRGRKPGVR
jgi:hypothetical protein